MLITGLQSLARSGLYHDDAGINLIEKWLDILARPTKPVVGTLCGVSVYWLLDKIKIGCYIRVKEWTERKGQSFWLEWLGNKVDLSWHVPKVHPLNLFPREKK